MTDTLKDKLSKVYELVKRGSSKGERLAAKAALDRLMKKYNLTEEALNDITKKQYFFTYSSNLEQSLFIQIVKCLVDEKLMNTAARHTLGSRKISIELEYIDWITIDSAYEYFRRHMKAEWNRLCAPKLKKCRKPKTRNRRRTDLQDLFITQYLIASNLTRSKDLKQVNSEGMSEKEMEDRRSLDRLEGGEFNRQVVGGLMLEE